MAKKYLITNYGNTRTVYIKGQSWEISKNSSIETTNEEVADAFKRLQFVDVKVIEQPEFKKKVTTGKSKKIKQSKLKGK